MVKTFIRVATQQTQPIYPLNRPVIIRSPVNIEASVDVDVNGDTLITYESIFDTTTITLSGDLSGTGVTNISATLQPTGVSAGTYRSVTVDAKGRVTAGSNPSTVAPYDMVGYWRGILPTDTSEPIISIEIVRSITLPADLIGSVSRCRATPIGDVSLPLKKNGTTIGTLDFAANASSGTFTFASDIVFSSGDMWEVYPPSPPDGRFAGLTCTIIATLN